MVSDSKTSSSKDEEEFEDLPNDNDSTDASELEEEERTPPQSDPIEDLELLPAFWIRRPVTCSASKPARSKSKSPRRKPLGQAAA